MGNSESGRPGIVTAMVRYCKGLDDGQRSGPIFQESIIYLAKSISKRCWQSRHITSMRVLVRQVGYSVATGSVGNLNGC